MENNPPNGSGTEDAPKPPNTTKFTLPREIPKLPSLRESIQEFVITTNNTLSSLEAKYKETIRKPMTQAMHQLSDTTNTITEQFHYLYQQRHIYGPYAVVGTSLLAGGITTLRRGRFSGLASTILVGGLSYGIIYGLDDVDDAIPAVTNIDLSKILPQSVTDLWKTK
jgi:hypothetical protein